MIRDALFHELETFSDQTALISGEHSHAISYRVLCDLADTLVQPISQRCLVFLSCNNSAESVAAYVGCMRARIVPALLPHDMDHKKIQFLLAQYHPMYFFLPKKKYEKTYGAIVGEMGEYALIKTNDGIDYLLYDHLALLITTSGSTGSPKFVRLSYRNILSNTQSIIQYLKITPHDRVITTMPMHYSYGLSILNTHLFSGASIVLTDASIIDKNFWNIFYETKPTTFGGVPYFYEMLKKLRFEKISLPAIRYLTQAGGKLSPAVCRYIAEACREKNIDFIVMYGQTEACARMSYLRPDHVLTKTGSIGVAIPGGQFWLENAQGEKIIESDVSGELVYQGDNVFLGYAENFSDLAEADERYGILHTGDIATRDVDGDYYIVGRKNRFLKMFGNRVNLNEMENILQEAGFECACAGEDNLMKIFITQAKSEESIATFISNNMNIRKTALCFIVVGAIPRNSAGKIMYTELLQTKEPVT